MGAFTLRERRVIAADPDAVWSVLGDYARDPAWRAGVRSMELDGDVLVPGATTTEVLRFGGRTYCNVAVVTAVGDRAVEWRTVQGADACGRRGAVAAPAGGCEATLEVTVTPHGVERALAPVLRRMLRRTLRADLRRFEQLVPAPLGVR